MLEKIKELFKKITAAVKDFIETSSRLTLILAGVSIFLIILTVMLAIIGSNVSRRNRQIPVVNDFSQTEEFFQPQSLTLTKDHYFYRDSQDKWDEQQSSEWFTMPSEKTINTLSESNDKIIDEITGAAP